MGRGMLKEPKTALALTPQEWQLGPKSLHLRIFSISRHQEN